MVNNVGYLHSTASRSYQIVSLCGKDYGTLMYYIEFPGHCQNSFYKIPDAVFFIQMPNIYFQITIFSRATAD